MDKRKLGFRGILGCLFSLQCLGVAQAQTAKEVTFYYTDPQGTPLATALVGHAIPMATTSDTGNAVSNENKARAQISGSSQRQADPAHVEGQLRKPEACGLLCSK